jgi:hypothetical protein
LKHRLLRRAACLPYQFQPYNLEVVDRQRSDPAEHFLISATGVTCIIGGTHSDHTPLIKWDRQRGAYDHICTLGFFRHYITRRSFSWWRKVGQHACVHGPFACQSLGNSDIACASRPSRAA